MFTTADLGALRERLRAATYTYDAVADALGERGQAALGRNSTLAGRSHIVAHPSPVGTLTRLFVLQDDMPRADIVAVLGEPSRWPHLLSTAGEHVRASIDVRPYGSPDDDASGWLVSDLTPGLDGRAPQVRTDWVLGASPASTTLAQMTIREPVGRALDLGTGCGVQSLHLARHARQVVATDLNPRACDLARATFGLNGIDVDVRQGSLYEPVAGERFDLIVSNPPYVMAPPSQEGRRLTYREGGLSADDLVREVVAGGVEHLNDGGVLHVLANWVTTPGDPGRRVVGWLADRVGLDVLVMERERLDRYAYIEMWLADAGLAGTSAWEPRYRDWLAYFDELGIDDVSMGWIVVRRRGDAQPNHIRSESWPYAVEQPVGPAFAQELEALAWSRELTDDDLLATRLRLRADVEEERTSTPGAVDPTSIVFRRRTGFCRAYLASSAMAAILSVCDGDLTVGQLVAAVAALTGQDAGTLRAEVVPELRRLLEESWFTNSGTPPRS